MAKLVVNPSSSQKREVPLPRTVLSIGRDPSNDLVLPDAMVSRRHAVVEWRGSQFFIRDCNSSNGSLVNGDRVSERGLRDGDLVAIGTARLLFRDDAVEEPGAKVVQHPSAPRLQCPACSADYRKGDLFCRQCGAPVAPPPPLKAVCASCGTAVILPARFCNACGRALPDDAAAPSHAAITSGAGGAAAAPASELAPAPELAPPLPPPPIEAVVQAEAAPDIVEAREPQEPEPPQAVVTAPPGLRSEVTMPTPPASLSARKLEPPRPQPPVPPRPARQAAARPSAHESRRPSQRASAGARLVAAIADGLVVMLAQSVVLGPLALYWWGRELPTDSGQLPFLPILLSLATIPVALMIGAGYYVWGWGVAGATPGKRLMGLVVETREGSSPIGPACAFVRLIGYAASALPLGLGFLLVPLSGEGLHDKLAGTRVSRRKE